MDFRAKRKRVELPLTLELIQALSPFRENNRIDKIIIKLEEINALEKKNKQPIITCEREVLIFLCLATEQVEEIMNHPKKAARLIELSKHCL